MWQRFKSSILSFYYHPLCSKSAVNMSNLTIEPLESVHPHDFLPHTPGFGDDRGTLTLSQLQLLTQTEVGLKLACLRAFAEPPGWYHYAVSPGFVKIIIETLFLGSQFIAFCCVVEFSAPLSISSYPHSLSPANTSRFTRKC